MSDEPHSEEERTITPETEKAPGGAERTTSTGPSANVVEFSEGEVIADQFDVIRVIGKGGMGIVYEVRDRITQEQLALKAILPPLLAKPNAAARFVQEVNIARKLRDPGIVAVYDVRQAGSLLFYTMELVEGRSLGKILEEQGKLPLAESLDILTRLCAVLEYAHKYTVHRDISPDNVMVLQDGSIKLLDFGIAKAVDTDLTLTTDQPMGKAFYIAPEQREPGAKVDKRADIFSLAVMFFEMLTGEFPSGYNTLSQLCPEVSPALEKVVTRGLAAKEKRFKTSAEFSKALVQAHRGVHDAPLRVHDAPLRVHDAPLRVPGAPLRAAGSGATAAPSAASPIYQARRDIRAPVEQSQGQHQHIRPESGSFGRIIGGVQGTSAGAAGPRPHSSPSGHDLQGILDEVHHRHGQSPSASAGRSSGFDSPPAATQIAGTSGANVPVFGAPEARSGAPEARSGAPGARSGAPGIAARPAAPSTPGGSTAVPLDPQSSAASTERISEPPPANRGRVAGGFAAVSVLLLVGAVVCIPLFARLGDSGDAVRPSPAAPPPPQGDSGDTVPRSPSDTPQGLPKQKEKSYTPPPPDLIPPADQEALGRINAAILSYKKDNGGTCPPTLRGLVPDYLTRVPRSSSGQHYKYDPSTGVPTMPD